MGSYVRYVRGTWRKGLYNASTPVVIRPLNPFLFGKNWASWHFLQNQGQNDLPLGSKKGHFSMKFWLQTLLKFFLWVIWCSPGYLEGPPRSGLYNAPTPVVIRPRNPFLFRKKVTPPPPRWRPVLETASLCFWFFTFSFHEATLEADIASYKWTIDTVDGALETLDLNLSKRDGVRKHPDVLGTWWEG